MVNGLDVADLVEPSDQTGGRFKWLWWLLNYNLGSQGARALGESLAKFQHFTVTCIYFDLWANNLGSQGARVLGQSPDRRLAQRFGFFEPRSLEFRLSWKTRNFLLLVYRWRVYSSCWNFLFVRTTDRPMLIWSSNLFICKCLLLMLDVESYRTIVLRSS